MDEALLVVARVGSTRLQKKVLADVGGCSIIVHVLSRAQHVALIRTVVLCTTNLPEDEVLCQIAARYDIPCFRGDSEDVPRRLLEASHAMRLKFFVLLEADEVFFDPLLVDQVIRHYRTTPADFIRFSKLPLGTWVSGIRVEALDRICRVKPPRPVDGWAKYFLEPGSFHVETIDPIPRLPEFDPQLRMTLDYPEDLQLMREIFARLPELASRYSLSAVLQLLTREPDLQQINRHRVEEYWRRFGSSPGGGLGSGTR